MSIIKSSANYLQRKQRKRSDEAHTGKGFMGRQLILWFVIIVMVVLGAVGIAIAALIGLICLVSPCVARFKSERLC
jgi:cytochrome b subunit of formate dehydrogenase